MNTEPSDTPAWTPRVDNPYLQGLYAPTVHESCSFDLHVEGELPKGLFGAYVRNGPNSVFEPRNPYHWFDGDGMVHAVYFREGKASYRSRLVPTTGLRKETGQGKALWNGIMGPLNEPGMDLRAKDTANTDVVWHNGKLFALWYLCGEPYTLDPLTLDPTGVDDFGGKRQTTISAHPKVDERTGEMVWFTLDDFEPEIVVVSKQEGIDVQNQAVQSLDRTEQAQQRDLAQIVVGHTTRRISAGDALGDHRLHAHWQGLPIQRRPLNPRAL